MDRLDLPYTGNIVREDPQSWSWRFEGHNASRTAIELVRVLRDTQDRLRHQWVTVAVGIMALNEARDEQSVGAEGSNSLDNIHIQLTDDDTKTRLFFSNEAKVVFVDWKYAAAASAPAGAAAAASAPAGAAAAASAPTESAEGGTTEEEVAPKVRVQFHEIFTCKCEYGFATSQLTTLNPRTQVTGTICEQCEGPWTEFDISFAENDTVRVATKASPQTQAEAKRAKTAKMVFDRIEAVPPQSKWDGSKLVVRNNEKVEEKSAPKAKALRLPQPTQRVVCSYLFTAISPINSPIKIGSIVVQPSNGQAPTSVSVTITPDSAILTKGCQIVYVHLLMECPSFDHVSKSGIITLQPPLEGFTSGENVTKGQWAHQTSRAYEWTIKNAALTSEDSITFKLEITSRNKFPKCPRLKLKFKLTVHSPKSLTLFTPLPNDDVKKEWISTCLVHVATHPE